MLNHVSTLIFDFKFIKLFLFYNCMLHQKYIKIIFSYFYLFQNFRVLHFTVDSSPFISQPSPEPVLQLSLSLFRTADSLPLTLGLSDVHFSAAYRTICLLIDLSYLIGGQSGPNRRTVWPLAKKWPELFQSVCFWVFDRRTVRAPIPDSPAS
jgi:hypothetical protein